MGVDGSVVPCHPPCSPPYYLGTALLSAADIMYIYAQRRQTMLKKRGKNRAQPHIIKTQASVSPHNVMMGYNWCISCLHPKRAFHAGLHKHTSSSCMLVDIFCKYLLAIFPSFFKWKGIMEIHDERPKWPRCSAHPFSTEDFFLLCKCIVLLQIITIKKPLIPHSVKLIELRKKCNDSN